MGYLMEDPDHILLMSRALVEKRFHEFYDLVYSGLTDDADAAVNDIVCFPEHSKIKLDLLMSVVKHIESRDTGKDYSKCAKLMEIYNAAKSRASAT